MRKGILLATLSASIALSISSQALAHTQPAKQSIVSNMPDYAFKARSKLPVSYIADPDQTALVLSGAIKGLSVKIFQFHGKAGQTVYLQKTGKEIEMAIFRPDGGEKFHHGQVLPETGVYELRIVNVRKDAAKTRRPRPYSLVFYLY